MSCRFMPCHVMLCGVVSCHVTPCLISDRDLGPPNIPQALLLAVAIASRRVCKNVETVMCYVFLEIS